MTSLNQEIVRALARGTLHGNEEYHSLLFIIKLHAYYGNLLLWSAIVLLLTPVLHRYSKFTITFLSCFLVGSACVSCVLLCHEFVLHHDLYVVSLAFHTVKSSLNPEMMHCHMSRTLLPIYMILMNFKWIDQHIYVSIL